MRILFALHGYLPGGRGGTEVHAHALARRLKGRHPVRVVCAERDEAKPDFTVTRDVYEGVEVTRINNLRQWVPGFEWVYKNPRVHEIFERELVAFRPDLVHVHHLTGLSTTIVETIKTGGLPLVMTLHDFWTVCPRGQRITKELEICEDVDRNICFHCLSGLWPQVFSDRAAHRTDLDSRGRLAPKELAEFDRHLAYVLNLADVLIAPSWFHRERMLDFPIEPERIVVLPHGLDHAPFRGIQRAPGPVKRIGFLGSVIPIKGAHVLVDAFRHLARPDLELHIHGDAFAFHDDKNYVDRLTSRAMGLRNVFFHGAYLPSDLPAILAGLDVLVVPSLWWESFCLTIREAQLAGVPVIASDLGAMREALDGEACGLLFPAGDARALALRIERIIEDPALRARLSRCQNAVKPLDDYVPELLALYERAQAVSAQRAATLVVAPPSFPDPPPEVRVSLSIPEGAAIAAGTPAALSDRVLRVPIADQATGAPLGTVEIAVESRVPVALRAAAVRAASNGGSVQPLAPPPSKAAEREAEHPPGEGDHPGAEPAHARAGTPHRAKTRRSRRHRRERRHRPGTSPG
jgi:glycosyltransferase involved in cell wall biosynthesis